MPELPEVEVVRQGLLSHLVDRRIAQVQVLHPRSVRRHPAGADDFGARLRDQQVIDVRRRGKYLWLALANEDAVIAHLGMSGQFRVGPADSPHLRIRLTFQDGGPEVSFLDQRTFGGMAISDGGADLPVELAHIARDPFDPQFDLDAAIAGIRRRHTGLKRALLDQTVVSGIGNIYADEALWHAQLHYARATDRLTRAEVRRVLVAAGEVMAAALGHGGTSFDSLYVNVNGESGYFDRSLNAYGRADLPCPRCGRAMVREHFMNRSSYLCLTCQPRPRQPHY